MAQGDRVRGLVIATQTRGLWDPLTITNEVDPLPTPDNRTGLGKFQPGTDDEATKFSMPGLDAVDIPTPRKGGDPNAGKGGF